MTPNTPALTCIHQSAGLCPACQADMDYDAAAYLEYGDHPAGLANWRALQAELAADAAERRAPAREDTELPF